MKCPYLFLVVSSTLLTCEGQRSNNDIIWYPVDDEDGVFISVYGEKFRGRDSRNSQLTKWRSHRQTRYTRTEQSPVQALPLSYDPTENQDPSFFHNINERRPGFIQEVPPFFDFEENRKKKPHKKPPGHAHGHENNLQGIFSEVFEYNKNPSTSQNQGSNTPYPEQKPTNQWGTTQGFHPGQRPSTGNQLGGRPQTGNQWGSTSQQLITGNQWGNNPKRPTTGNQWGSLVTEFPEQRPITNTNQPQTWGTSGIITSNQNQWGSTRPVQRPNEWTTMGNMNRPNRPDGSDILVFPDDTTRNNEGTSRFTTTTTTTTPSDLGPVDPPTMSPCERRCPVTPEFNPVCGSDMQTYTNLGRLKCAQMCGKDVKLSHHGNCGRTTLVTPLVSNNRAKKFKGLFLLSD